MGRIEGFVCVCFWKNGTVWEDANLTRMAAFKCISDSGLAFYYSSRTANSCITSDRSDVKTQACMCWTHRQLSVETEGNDFCQLLSDGWCSDPQTHHRWLISIMEQNWRNETLQRCKSNDWDVKLRMSIINELQESWTHERPFNKQNQVLSANGI